MHVLTRDQWPPKWGPRRDISGQRFGNWRVLGLTRKSSKNKIWYWAAECVDCPWGTIKEVFANDLVSGNTTQCQRCSTSRMKKTHGESKTPFYTVWKAMIGRCTRPSDSGYSRYGARGITVCDRWMKYENFRADMLPTYQAGLQLERIDNDGSYSPRNCRWATHSEQMSNTQRTVLIEWAGQTLTISQWADVLGINMWTLRARVQKSGWSLGRAFTEGVSSATLDELGCAGSSPRIIQWRSFCAPENEYPKEEEDRS